MLQETAWRHAHLLGKGFAERESGSLFWVLSRLRLRVDQYPKWGEEFVIQTWPVGTERLLAVRDFAMVLGDTVVGRMRSGWLVVDGASGRPVRPEKLVGDLPLTESEFDGDLSRIPSPPEAEDGPQHCVQYHDIDQYRHANNTAYLEWITDALAMRASLSEANGQDVTLARIRVLAMDFLKELVLRDRYRTRIADLPGHTVCEIVRDTDGEPVCRASMTWEEK